MRIEQFFHIARAACAVANVDAVTVFGSNAILPWLNEKGIRDMRQFLDLPYISRELDLCVGDGTDDTLNTLVDGAIGELSQFDETFGVYAHPNPLTGLFHAPSSWTSRMRRTQEPVSRITIIVPHYADLTVSKLVAGRAKDMEFARRARKVFDVSMQQIKDLLHEYLQEVPAYKTAALNHLSIFEHHDNVKFPKAPVPKKSFENACQEGALSHERSPRMQERDAVEME